VGRCCEQWHSRCCSLAVHARAAAAQAEAWGLVGDGPGRGGAGEGVRRAAGGGGAGRGCRAILLKDLFVVCIRAGIFLEVVGGAYVQALGMYKVAQDCALLGPLKIIWRERSGERSGHSHDVGMPAVAVGAQCRDSRIANLTRTVCTRLLLPPSRPPDHPPSSAPSARSRQDARAAERGAASLWARPASHGQLSTVCNGPDQRNGQDTELGVMWRERSGELGRSAYRLKGQEDPGPDADPWDAYGLFDEFDDCFRGDWQFVLW
jgi:hypothetical protein